MQRINPQAIALNDYKPKAKPVTSSVTRPQVVTAKTATSTAPVQRSDNIAHSDPRDYAIEAAMKLLSELKGVSAMSAPAPVRSLIAKKEPVVMKVNASAVGSTNDAELMKLRAELATIRELYTKATAENVQLRDDLDSATAQLCETDELQYNYSAAITELDGARYRLAKYSKRKEQLIAANAKIQQDYETIEKLTESVGTLTEQLNTLQCQLSNTSDYDSLLAQLINAQESVLSLEEEASYERAVNKSNHSAVQSLKTRVAELESELQGIWESNETAQKERDQCRAGLNDATQAYIVQSKEFSVLNAKHDELKAKHEKLLNGFKGFVETLAKK